MNNVLYTILLLFALTGAQPASAQQSFQQVSDHCYFLPIEENGENIAAVVTGQGTVLFDPPPEPDLSILIAALNELAGTPVRWMMQTGVFYKRTAGVDHFAREGAVMLEGYRQREPSLELPEAPPLPEQSTYSDLDDTPDGYIVEFPAPSENETTTMDSLNPGFPSYPRFTFKKDLYLYPEDLEIKIQAVSHEARTGADIVAYVPQEKVLFVGRLFEPDYYPDIDISTGGSAVKWIDAMQEVIDSIPLLISAIPPEEPEEEKEDAAEEKDAEPEKEEPEEEEEKTLEEMIAVVPARGEVSNLQVMKEMLETSKQLLSGVSRTVKAGRSCKRYLESSEAAPYRVYGNFFPYATRLCEELEAAGGKAD
jgi:hypothetical protein